MKVRELPRSITRAMAALDVELTTATIRVGMEGADDVKIRAEMEAARERLRRAIRRALDAARKGKR